MNAQLTGSTALITGSTSGIGRATADALAELGAHVIISGRDTGRGETAVAEIRAAGGKADFIAVDLRDAASARSLAEQAVGITGQVDILVNNAGIYSFGATTDFDEQAFDDMYATNVKAPYFLVSELAPRMAARGRGSIVNITTVAAYRGLQGGAVYGSTKAALSLLTKSWASEFAPSGVRVNAVSPGPIATPGTAAMDPGMLQAIADSTQVKRIGQATEVAAAVAFLVSDNASYIHGAVIPVDGGGSAN
jgi:NAD(P)-dependent dehydrogenase (short-subunit alcohol dehydrogenase family)